MDFLSNLFGHDEAQQHYQSVYTQPHEAKFSHECTFCIFLLALIHISPCVVTTIILVLAGAAGFAAMHEYEEHLRRQGQPVTHEKMKASPSLISRHPPFYYY